MPVLEVHENQQCFGNLRPRGSLACLAILAEQRRASVMLYLPDDGHRSPALDDLPPVLLGWKPRIG